MSDPRPGTALRRAALLLALVAGGCLRPTAPPLETRLGRSEVRVWSAPFPLVRGEGVRSAGIPERLRRLGYTRVREKPRSPGEFFWGSDVLWIYRHGCRWNGRDWPPRLLRLTLDPRGEVTDVRAGRFPFFRIGHQQGLWLEPEVLAEALDGRTAPRLPVRLDELPEHVWQPVLAAEDHRFFHHFGIDPRGLVRAALANLRGGHVAQGGSTLTQQLVKNRDLTPERSIGRKISEAWRALELESEHPKKEILEVYLDHVYLGQVAGLAVHGFGAGAAAYFGKPARELEVQEAALLAGMIRSPNRLSPLRHPEEAKARRDQVLALMAQYGWLTPQQARAAQARPLGLHPLLPRPPMAASFLDWSASVARRTAPDRIAAGRGVVLETTLDPLLQSWAESTVITSLGRLRRLHPQLRHAPLGVALVALDPDTGDVLAYVGSPPGSLPGGFDRARQAERQPGSLVKPFVLLEAFDRCAGAPTSRRGAPLYPATRVADEPLQLPWAGEIWQPLDADRRFEGVITVREALRESRNVPFVRIARHCGFDATAQRVRAAGLSLPSPLPPSFVLGAVEETPLAVAESYTVFATPGDAVRARPVTRVERPGGSRLDRVWVSRHHVVEPATAYLVIDLLRDAAAHGTARAAAIPDLVVAAKTGTTSESRDAWLAGHAGGLVTVVWVGRDDGAPLGLTGSQAAAPLWRDFMRVAVALRPPRHLARPYGVVDRWVDDDTGLLVGDDSAHAHVDVFRDDALPPRERWWRSERPIPVVE